MAYNHEYPYVDPNRYNSDWLLNKVKELEGEMNTFEALNKITFDGEWDITKNYPAWTIVNTNGGTEGYISVKPVPAGVLISDTNYWSSVVNYTATIADLQNRVVALETAVDHIADRKYIFISDSYGARTYDGKTLIENISAFAGIPATDYASVQLNGSGFIGIGPDSFETILTNAVLPFDDADVTDIIVMGGANDITTDVATVRAAIESFCNYAFGRFTNASIRLAHTGRFWDKSRADLLSTVSLPAWRDCQEYGAAYIANSEYILHKRSLVESDNVHPTSSGVYEIARQMAEALRVGYCDVHYQTGGTFSVHAGTDWPNVTIPDNGGFDVFLDNGTVTVQFAQGTRIFAQPASLTILPLLVSIPDICDAVQTDPVALFGNTPNGISKGTPASLALTDNNNAMLGTVPGSAYIGSSDNMGFVFHNRFMPGNTTNQIAGVQIFIPCNSLTMSSEYC